jgi:hypothetical protein
MTRIEGINAIQRQNVKMHVEIERASKALHGGDGADVGKRKPASDGAALQKPEHGAHANVPDAATRLAIERDQESQRDRQREHPLTNGHMRQLALDEWRQSAAAGELGGASERVVEMPRRDLGEKRVLGMAPDGVDRPAHASSRILPACHARCGTTFAGPGGDRPGHATAILSSSSRCVGAQRRPRTPVSPGSGAAIDSRVPR